MKIRVGGVLLGILVMFVVALMAIPFVGIVLAAMLFFQWMAGT